MSKKSSVDVGYLLVGPWNLTLISNKLGYALSDPVADTTPFAVSAAQFEKLNLKTYEISDHESWYDDDEYTAAAEMVALAAGDHVFMFSPEGNIQGKPAICTGGLLYPGFKVTMEQGAFHKAAMTLAVDGTLDVATIIAALTSRAGNLTTEATYVDLGATGGGTTGGNLYLSCTALALTGSTNLIVSTEDSTDHVSWAAHTAFTALTAVGAEKKIISDMTVNRYYCIKTVYTGLAGTPSATFTVALKVNSPH